MAELKKCSTCGYKPNHPLWECARVECPNRKPWGSLPSDVAHDGYEPMLDGYVTKPKLED